MVDNNNDDNDEADAGAWVYYKLTYNKGRKVENLLFFLSQMKSGECLQMLKVGQEMKNKS